MRRRGDCCAVFFIPGYEESFLNANNSLWIAIIAIILIYVVSRWMRSRNRGTEIGSPEEVRYLIRSGETSAAPEIGAASGLVVSRYYFRNLDIAVGPADPNKFYDELFIELEAKDSQQTWKNSIHVATPRGLESMMVEENWDSVIGGELLIVRKYDLPTILNAAVEHLQEIYEVQVTILGHGGTPPTETV